MPLVNLGFVQIQSVFAGGHDYRHVTRFRRLDYVRAINPIYVAAKQAVQQVNRAIWAAAAFGQFFAVHLVCGNDSGKHDVALEVAGIEVNAKQGHERLPL